MFNFLTGFARPRAYRRVLLAPAHMRAGILEEIERTVAAHREGRAARIRMKMNSLVDRACIQALYRASQAGVPVELNLARHLVPAPGRPGRVGEHPRRLDRRALPRALADLRLRARRRDCTVYIGSADLMPRNLDTRVEMLTPVLDEALRADLLDTLDRCFADNVNAWELGEDGTWTRRHRRRRAPFRAA